MNDRLIQKKSFLFDQVKHKRVSILLLFSIALVSSSLYLLPLAYSQKLYFGAIFREQGTPEAKLSVPEGVAIDPSSGNVYVADTANSRIQVFSSNGTFITKWGKYGAGNGSFSEPEGVAIDPSSGNVYVADTANSRIQVFSSNGTFITKWGGFGSVRNGTLSSPEGVAIDPSSGNVYVADTANHRIQVFSSNGTFITKWGGFGAGAGNGTLSSPGGIAVDPSSGNVYVADTANHRIQVFSSNGTFITKTGKYGILENSRSEENMRSPRGIAVDPSSGNVYVADTANNRIVGFAPYSLNTNVSFSSEDGEVYGNETRIKIERVYEGLKFPTSIAFLGPNDMLVLQRDNETITRIVNGQMLDEPVLADLGNTVKNVGCMCDIALLKNDDGTTYAFLYYYTAEVTQGDGTTKVLNRLYQYNVTNGKFTNPKLIFEMPSSLGTPHNGGKLTIGPDNNVYLTIGEIDYYRTKAQNVKNGSLPDGSGSILRFTPNGEAVNGGLLGHSPPLDKYYAYGIRNSFGLGYDPVTGNIWMTDNGPDCCDELNIVKPAFNGGHNKIMGTSSLREAFNLTDLESFNGTGKYYDPVFEWLVPVGVTDLVFIPSDKLGKEYEGNLIVGDINSGYLYRFILNQSRTGLLLNDSLSDGVANNNIEKQEAAFAKLKRGGITDLEIGPDGLVYIVSLNGKIMRLEPISANVTLPLMETTNVTETESAGSNTTGTGGGVTETTGATGDGGGGGGVNTTKISIVPRSSELTDTAFSPNPVQASVGDTVTWTNDDSTTHTVTSGQNGKPDGKFDSSPNFNPLLAPGATFSHTFTEAGQYPYYCQLHPNMVGTVSVTS